MQNSVIGSHSPNKLLSHRAGNENATSRGDVQVFEPRDDCLTATGVEVSNVRMQDVNAGATGLNSEIA